MEKVPIELSFCEAWASVLNCNAELSKEYFDFAKFVIPYISEGHCGLTVKSRTKVTCFPITYALAIITWAGKNKQSLSLKSVDNQVVFEFLKPKK